MKTLHALMTGIRTTNRSFRLIALLYSVNLLIAAILAWGFHSVLTRTIGDSMSLENLVKGFDYTVYSDYLFKYGGRITALLSQISWLIFFYLLLNTLLGGGTIASLKDSNNRFSMSSFFENCGAYFFRFLRLLLIFGVILLLIGFVSSMAFGILYSVLASNAVSEVWPIVCAVILFLLFLFVVMLIVMMADYAKVATVVDDAQSMLKTSWQGIKFVFQHFPSTVGLQSSMIILLLIAVVAYLILENQIGMSTPLAILTMFIIQQASVGFKVWSRVATVAGEINLFDTLEPKPAVPSVLTTTTAPTQEPSVVASDPMLPVAQTQLAWKKRVTRRPAARKVTVRRKKSPRKPK